MGNILIITGGPVQENFCRRYIEAGQWSVIIAADRGLEICKHCRLEPDLILGDFDSADPDITAYYEDRFPERFCRYPAVKNETDTEIALEKAFAYPGDEIHILGALGGRIDHMLANISLLKKAVRMGKRCYLADENTKLFMTDHPVRIKKGDQSGTLISLLAYGNDVRGLTLKGFAYETDQMTLHADSARGISNYLVEENGLISFSEGMILVIETGE